MDTTELPIKHFVRGTETRQSTSPKDHSMWIRQGFHAVVDDEAATRSAAGSKAAATRAANQQDGAGQS